MFIKKHYRIKAVVLLYFLLVKSLEFLSRAEEKRNAPDTRKGYYGVDYAAKQSILTSADPRNDIKTEYTDATPVERTDYRDNQGNSIHDHKNSSFETEFPFKDSLRALTLFMIEKILQKIGLQVNVGVI